MKIAIAGGTGFIGQVLMRYLHENYEFVILTRGKNREEGRVRYVHWDAETLGDWKSELEGTDALINLNGKSVNCRYNDKNKKLIVDTRVNATRVLGEALKQLSNPPQVWINASSATIYEYEYQTPNNEYNHSIGKGFSVEVCKQWEQAFNDAEVPGVRKVVTRITIVMGNGSAFKMISNLAKFGLGGTQGPGNQMVSWIHEKDYARLIEFIIKNDKVSGVVNAAAPNPVTNKEFMKAVRKSVKAPFGIPQASWMIKLGAVLMGTESELVLKSRYVVSKKLEELGFEFEFKEISNALNNLNN